MTGKMNFKKLWKRNQIMITALALMIAIAGFLNFTGKQIDDEVLFTTSAQFEEADAGAVEETLNDTSSAYEETIGLYDISMEDVEYYTEIESLDEDIVVSEAETTGELEVAEVEEGEVPGEAVFTNAMSVTSLAEANLLKEQTRANNKQALLDIINNENVSEAAKQEAVNSMISLTDLAQKECDILIMLEAKGFAEAVVSIGENNVDVCIGKNDLTPAEIAQIEDVVKRKTGIAAENIIISPVGEN